MNLELGQMMFSNSEPKQFEMQEFVLRGIQNISDFIVELFPELEGYGPAGRAGTNSNRENEVFSIRSYCWCDGEEHETCPPNFQHYATGFECAWYKWAGRGNTQNKILKFLEWNNIYNDCIKELQGKNV